MSGDGTLTDEQRYTAYDQAGDIMAAISRSLEPHTVIALHGVSVGARAVGAMREQIVRDPAMLEAYIRRLAGYILRAPKEAK